MLVYMHSFFHNDHNSEVSLVKNTTVMHLKKRCFSCETATCSVPFDNLIALIYLLGYLETAQVPSKPLLLPLHEHEHAVGAAL